MVLKKLYRGLAAIFPATYRTAHGEHHLFRFADTIERLESFDTEDEPGPRSSPLWEAAAKSAANYGYGPTFAKFKHVWHWGRFRPDTTVLSNYVECPL